MKKRIISTVLTASLFISAFTGVVYAGSFGTDSYQEVLGSAVSITYGAEETSDAATSGVNGFVTRLYDICLDRRPDAKGLNDWSSKLVSGNITGMEAAYGFIFSSEFQGRNLGNEDYVEKMYLAFLGRASDPAGKKSWVDLMDQGMSRMDLFLGFANSTEFTDICRRYGIERGEYSASNGFVNTPKIRAFVTRLYDVCLGRQPDTAGLDDWTAKLASGSITGTEAAAGFFFSNEYKEMKRSNEDFVENLYNCFLGRSSDPAGKADWVSQLEGGAKDITIFNGFSQSNEYNGICSSYGINRGGAYVTNDSCRKKEHVIDPDHGSAATLDGKILIVSVFASDSVSSWNPESEADVALMYRTKDKLGIATDYISQNAAQYGHDVKFVYDWSTCNDLFCYAAFDHDLVNRVSGWYSLQANWITDERTIGLMNKYDADGVLYMFFFNTDYSIDTNSGAIHHRLGSYIMNEFCNMNLKHDGYEMPSASFAHEIIHCFGAPDLYYSNDIITQAYVDHLGNTRSSDIMFTVYGYDDIRNAFTSLDAYYVGIGPRPAEADQFSLGVSEHG